MPSPRSPDADARAELLAELRRLERAARPLEPGATRRKRLRGAAMASGERFLRGLANQPAYVNTDDKSAGLLAVPFGERGRAIDEVLRVFEREVVGPGAHPASPGHLAYIPGGGLYHSALGDYLAAVSNKYAGVFFSSPGAVRMENMVVRWAADLLGYPASAGGAIASGGSIATLAAVCTARDAHGITGAAASRAVVYLTAQAHHSIQKSLRIAGLAESPVRLVAMDEGHRMRPDALAATIAADRAAGLEPWLVMAAAGTTDTGAVDPLDAIATITARERCWFHVDAAYGGFFLLTEHGCRTLAGIERSDSAVLDPHKGMFLPYGAGIVVVRDAATLLAAHRETGAYMQDVLEDPSELSPSDVSPELSKHFRGLRIWLPLMLLGTGPFTAALGEKLLLARYFRAQAAELGFEVGPPPDLSIVTFRWVPHGGDEARADRINRAIVDGVRLDGRVFLSSTMLEGRFTLRMAVLAFRTHRRTIDLALRVLRDQVAAAAGVR